MLADTWCTRNQWKIVLLRVQSQNASESLPSHCCVALFSTYYTC